MAKNSDFTLYNEIIKYDRYVRKYVANNIPNIYRDLRIHLLDEIYSLKKNLLYAQCNKGNIRIKYITEMIVNISMLDLISDDINEYCPKIKKYIQTSISELTIIRNMTYAWRNNPEPNEKRSV